MAFINLNKALTYMRALTGCLMLFAASQSAFAFNFTVNDLSDAVDSTPGDGICEATPAAGDCTLRAAIQESNAWPGKDSIHIPAATHTLSLTGDDNSAAAGDLDITEALSIHGASQALSIIDANNIDRAIDIHGVDVQIENLTIQNGSTVGTEGGGIRSVLGKLTIRNATIDSNETTGFGYGGGGIYSAGPLVIDNATISNNRSSRGGGLLHFSYDMTITNSRINSNLVDLGAGSGGGIFIQSDGTNTIINTTIDGNTAALGGGGGIYTVNGLTLTNSTISNNTALLVGGGGIYDIGLAPLVISNSTISSNDATGNGGGIQVRQSRATVINSTIYGNRAFGTHDVAQETYNGHGGGIYLPSGSSIALTNTIIAGNTASVLTPAGNNCYSQNSTGVFSAIQTTSEYVISDDSTCELTGTGDQPNTTPSLSSVLGTNGGLTLTHAVLFPSAVIDSGPSTPANCYATTTDQRGFPRPVDGGSSGDCDIGAFEYNATTSVADIGVTIEADRSPVLNGATLTYTVKVTNHGPDTATNVVLADDLAAANVSYLSDTGSCSGAPALSCSLGTITSGSSQTITISVTAPATPGQITNTISVAATENDLNASNNSATKAINVIGSSDLSVTITGSVATATANVPMSYDVVITNNSTVTANDVIATIQFDAAVSLGQVSPAVDCGFDVDSAYLICELGNIAGSDTLTLNVTITPLFFGSITSDSSVTFSGTDPDLSNNTSSASTAVIANAALSITTTDSPDPAYQNADILYNFTVANSGPSTTNNTKLVVTFPAGMSLSPASGASPAGCSGAGTVTCDLGAISGGFDKTITLVAIANADGTYTVNSSATSNETSGPALDSETTVVNPPATPSPPDADLLVTMVDTADPVVVGNSITYNVTATNNNGPNVAQNVVISVTLPATTTFSSASSDCVYNSGVVTCALGPLAVGLSSGISVTVNSSSVGTFTAFASVSDSVGNDPELTNNTTTQSTKVNAAGSGGGTAGSRLNSGGGGSYEITELGVLLFMAALLFNRRRQPNTQF